MPLFVRKVSAEDILSVVQQLSTAVSAGVRLKTCLDRMAQDSDVAELATALAAISRRLGEGSTLSDAMAEHPRIFPRFQCRLVKVGEASGKLAEILKRLADDMDGREVLVNKVRSAVVYPAFVLSVALVMSAAMLAWGVPQIKSVYEGMGSKLPAPTMALVLLGQSLGHFWYLWLAGLVLAFVAVRRLLARPQARRPVEAVLLRFGPLGEVLRLLNVAIFCRTLGLLYRSGMNLSTALDILQESMDSPYFADQVHVVRERILHGETMSAALRATGAFPSLTIEMVTTGETTGSLEKMLEELDRLYTRRCNAAIDKATALIEPVLVLLVGFLLGGIIIGLAIPLLNMPALLM